MGLLDRMFNWNSEFCKPEVQIPTNVFKGSVLT